ncbi:hypothetical protein PYCC9005_004244 [Savitreella phatthalungensis]
MGGGAYPFNKHVWTPTGGWWSRPANWKSNTAIALTGCAGIVAWVWSVSAEKETRDHQPTHWIPSMLWSKALKDNPSLSKP